MSRGGEDEGFLSRWSRRKRREPEDGEAAEEAGAAEEAPGGDADTPGAVEAGEEEDEAAVLARLGLPDPDTLWKGDDFSVFMRAAVPEAIRRRALRRLWRSNPTLAVLDGLNDYDGDFTGGFVKPGTLQTAYKVGRGFLQAALEEGAEETEAARAIAPDPEADAPRPAASSVRAPGEPAPDRAAEVAEEVAETPSEVASGQETAEAPAPEDAPARPTARRMAFRFPDA